MQSNTYCTLCTECVKTCPHDNVTIDVRPWGADVASLRRPRRDEAALALVLLSMTSFHGLTMTPAWGDFVGALRRASGTSHLAAFTLGMALVLALPGLCFFGASALSARWSRRRLALAGERASAAKVAAASAYAIIPIALMYHLAHNAGHFLNEAYKILPVLLDPLGARPLPAALAGLDAPLVGQPTVWGLAVGLVLLGHLWSTRALDRAFALIPGGRPRARWPVAAFMLLATIVNLVLLAQPMEMRSGM